MAGVTIENSQATDMEEGPEEPDPASDRVPIISTKYEYYVHASPAEATEADIALQLRATQDSMQAAVSTTRKSVEQARTHAGETSTQLQIAASAEQASEAVKQAASESSALAVAKVGAVVKTDAKVESTGIRQVAGSGSSSYNKPPLWLMKANMKCRSLQS